MPNKIVRERIFEMRNPTWAKLQCGSKIAGFKNYALPNLLQKIENNHLLKRSFSLGLIV